MTRTFAVIAVILVSFTATTTQADFSNFELEADLQGSESVSLFHGWGEGPVMGTFFGQACEGGWWQARLGASYTITPNLTLGASVGAEDTGWRGAMSLMASHGYLSLTAIHEDGASGQWHKDKLLYSLSERLAVGLVDQSYCGRGATARYNLDGNTAVNYSLFEGGNQLLSVARSF